MAMLFKRIKDWATSITSFRTGDVIAVDGPNGTAKMSKDALIDVTYSNALSLGASVIDCSKFLLGGGMIKPDGTWYQNTWYQGVLIPVNDFIGKFVKLVCNASTPILRFAFLKDAVVCDESPVNFCTGYSLYETAIIYYGEIPADCNYIYLYVYNREASPRYFYPTLSIVDETYLCEYQTSLDDTSYIPRDKVGLSNGFIDVTTSKFVATPAYRGCFIPAKLLFTKKLVLKRNAANIRIAFLKNGILLNDTIPSFSDALNGVLEDSTHPYLEFDIPSDCEFIYLYADSAGTDVMPRTMCGDSVKNFYAKTKSMARLKITEFNLGGFANGQSFVNPNDDVLKDLRKFITDCSPDIFIPCETGTLQNWRDFEAMQFNRWNNFPAGWGGYDTMPCIQSSHAVLYKDLKLKLDPTDPSSIVKNSRMIEVYVKGYRVAIVPVHFFPLDVYVDAGIDVDGLKASFDDWFGQISESDYDAVLICGDTNIRWDVDYADTHNLYLINYFKGKGYIYVNGGCGSTNNPSVSPTFTQIFSEITYTPVPCVIDQLLIKSNNPNLRVSATFKVLSPSEMQSKYPYLYAVTENDHLPSIYDVYFG